jgi:hypothetical protein
MMSKGGKPRGVYVVTDADLEGAVDGTFVIQPGPAMPTTGFAQATRGVSGGKPYAVYVVTEAEANRRGLMGGKPIPIVDMTSSGRGVDGPFIAVPIYILSGADNIGGGGVTPVPPTPPTPAVPTESGDLIETFMPNMYPVQDNQELSEDEFWGGFIT